MIVGNPVACALLFTGSYVCVAKGQRILGLAIGLSPFVYYGMWLKGWM